jgi:hypothetical protein
MQGARASAAAQLRWNLGPTWWPLATEALLASAVLLCRPPAFPPAACRWTATAIRWHSVQLAEPSWPDA